MRIPSQLNDENLYRRGHRRGESSQNYRRVFQLLLGLALVVVVMRQAASPRIYQPFFETQVFPVTLDDPTASGASPDRGGDAHRQIQARHIQELWKTTKIDAQDRRIANELIGNLAAPDQQAWSAALSRWLCGENVKSVPSAIDEVQQRLARIEPPETRRLVWKRMLDSFSSSSSAAPSSSNRAGGPSKELASPAIAMFTVLGEAISRRVVDGTVWKSGDAGAFYMHLSQAGWFSPDAVATVGVLPLLQQPDVFRGQLVRIQGRVARSQRFDAQENAFGVQEYWQLWLRPSHGADRPITVIVPSVPANIGSLGAEFGDDESSASAVSYDDGPRVVVLGKFLKRLSYASARGAELAPAIVGRLIAVPVEADVAVSSVVGNQSPRTASRDWLILALASGVGLFVAIFAFYRTSVSARRSREFRIANRKEPTEFLEELRARAK